MQHKLAETLYRQAAPGTGAAEAPGGGASPNQDGGDVIDAEVVDDGKK